MAVAKDSRKTGVRILLGAVVLVLGGSMLLYLVPQTPGTGEASSTDIVAKVGSETVSTAEVRQQLAEIEQRNQVPKQLESLYARQILNQLIFQKEMEYEAKRLGIRVSDPERAARIRQFLPTAYNGDTFVGMDRYAAEGVAIISGGEKLADAVGALLVGNANPQALGFVFHFLLKDELVENLARVQGFQLLGNLIALLNFRELLADFGGADGFAADFRVNVAR